MGRDLRVSLATEDMILELFALRFSFSLVCVVFCVFFTQLFVSNQEEIERERERGERVVHLFQGC